MIVILLLFVFVILIGFLYTKKNERNGPFHPQGPKIKPIESSFQWDKTPPRKFRPFKPKYSLTMGLSTPDHQDWLLIEDSYLNRVNYHKEIFESSVAESTCLCHETAESAVQELYDYSLDFALARFPRYFKKISKAAVLNTIINRVLPATSTAAIHEGKTSRDLLRLLGENFEEDFLLLGFDPDVQEYRLRACTGIAAEGFTWANRMNMKLTDIHHPIPQYKERLQFSMNKAFRNMVPGNLVQRTTYAVQVSSPNDLYVPDGTEKVDGTTDLDECGFLRLERQQLTRLKKSGFICFSIRTYMYPLRDIKSEGLGEAMIDAVNGWPDDFAVYKHRADWSDSIFKYLKT